MKKYNQYLLLSMLIAFSFFIGSSFIIQKPAKTTPATSSASTSLSQHFNAPDAEIEHYNNSVSHGVYSQQGLQKIPGHLSYQEKAFVNAKTNFFTHGFPPVELFDNNNLCHNYPSHNFW